MGLLSSVYQKNAVAKDTSILKTSTIENNVDTSGVNYYIKGSGGINNVGIFENGFKLPADAIFEGTKSYKFVFSEKLRVVMDAFIDEKDKEAFDQEKDEEKKKEYINSEYIDIEAVPSLFNPLFGIHIRGINTNTPLMYNDSIKVDEDLSDCSIRTLVDLSKSGKMGRSIYKYADFMYCKDLGKIPNNRLITLRRFALPIGDDIWNIAKSGEEGYDPKISTDVGRLVTWLNDDNKLEDILKYNYKDSFTQKKGEYENINSQSDNQDRGILGSIINLANPTYRRGVIQGTAGSGNILLGKFSASVGNGKIFSNQGPYQNHEILTRYDKYKIYEPKGTIRDTYLYEGEMTFDQNFTLVFDYELRAYDNINPRSAFYDLLGNIQQVIYRKGNFWGGAPWFIGAPENKKGWQRAESIITSSGEKMDIAFNGIFNGNQNIGDLLGSLSNKLGKVISGAFEAVSNGLANFGETLKQAKTAGDKVEATGMLKGLLQNQLGRPSIYALSSYLDGSPTGLWHVTIGNPRNPIMSMGNMIIDGSTIQHYGPLGIDDFPTGIKVTVNLKHAKSRDNVEIGKMYTMGTTGLYIPIAKSNVDKIVINNPTGMDRNMLYTNLFQPDPMN